MNAFKHVADTLKTEKPVVFTAQSAKNFHQRMLICRHAFKAGVVPINPFNVFGYYLYELVERDVVRNANNNLLQRCDELWVYGDISDGIMSEIVTFRASGKPVRYFDISQLPDEIREVTLDELSFETEVASYRDKFITDVSSAPN